MTTFTFDVQRNYDPNDIKEYLKHVKFLKSKFPNYANTLESDSEIRTQEQWTKLQNSKEKIPNSLKLGSFYVYFEMPERCGEYYRKFDIPYLNFMTPKIRFNTLPECFMIESNLDIPEELFLNHIKMPQIEIINELCGETLIIGQMTCDRSTIFDGVAKSVFDYKPEGTIYRPHPHTTKYQPEYAKKELARASEMGVTIDQTQNVYNVLASVKKVVGISSGTLYEASLLGTEIQFLDEKDYISRAKLIETKNIDREFWNTILRLI